MPSGHRSSRSCFSCFQVQEDDDLATSAPGMEINKGSSNSSITALPVTTKLRNELRTSSGRWGEGLDLPQKNLLARQRRLCPAKLR